MLLTLLYITIASVLGFRYLWILFLAVMNLKQAKDADQLHGFAYGLGKTVLVEGLIVDAIIQLTVANLIWLEFPRELTVSGRVARLCEHGTGFRKARAIWFRDTLLRIFDRSGGHG